MNTNKYLAYTSLCQTNSEIWQDFDIDRAIVVDDITYNIPNQTVRYIYTESPEDKKKLKQLKEKLLSVKAELHIIKIHKKSSPKGYKREKNEIKHEKELLDEKNSFRMKSPCSVQSTIKPPSRTWIFPSLLQMVLESL